MNVYLRNYYRLIERVDRHADAIQKQYGHLLACRKGCSACCIPISVFPVEAVAMMDAIRRLPPDSIPTHSNRPDRIQPSVCPLLSDDNCLIYSARPLICRTHGLPLLTAEADHPVISCCPRNFRNVSPFPSSTVIDLEALNRMLIAVNALFLKEWPEPAWASDRIRVADLIHCGITIDLTP